MNENNFQQIADDEINLTDILKTLLRQRGIIFAATLFFLLLALVYQLSKVAFYTPKTVKYPIAIEFISAENMGYPNNTAFSVSDIIAPDNIQQALNQIETTVKLEDFISAISASNSNPLFEDTEKYLLTRLGDKKLPADQVEAVKDALNGLKLASKTYTTLQLDLSEVKLSAGEATKLLEAIVASWSDNAIKEGLINPNVSYPSEPFSFDKEAVIIDNYDKLNVYVGSLKEALEKLALLKGSDSIRAEGKSLSDLSRNINELLLNDIGVMRAYAYSISPQLVTKSPMLEVQIFSQRRVKSLNKEELKKQIDAYDEILSKLDTNVDRRPLKTQVSFDAPTVETGVEKGTLNELLDLGSQLSSSELKKEVIQKRIEVAERLFELEKELAMIEGKQLDDTAITASQMTIIEKMPMMFAKTVNEVNNMHATFIQWIEAYKRLVLNKGSRLYSQVSSPFTVNSLGISLKKVLLTLAAASLMGFFLGVMLALVRTSFNGGNKNI